jgi:hypothetical protein
MMDSSAVKLWRSFRKAAPTRLDDPILTAKSLNGGLAIPNPTDEPIVRKYILQGKRDGSNLCPPKRETSHLTPDT